MSQPSPGPEASEFRFRIPLQWQLPCHLLGLIYVVGLDGVPWPCKIRIDRESPAAAEGPIVHVARNQYDSGHVFFVFPHPQRGELLLSTGTLPLTNSPYDMLKELARGTLNRVRSQLSIWQEGGLAIPTEIPSRLHGAVHHLAQAIMTDDVAQQDELASRAIREGVDLIFEIAELFGQQIAKYRFQNPELSKFWVAQTAAPNSLGIALIDDEMDYIQVRNLDAAVDCLQAVIDSERPMIVGPWLDASAGGMPSSWVSLSDHLNRRAERLAALRDDLNRLPENVQLLHLVSGINGIGHRYLSYPQLTQLTVEMLQLVDESRVDVPVMVSFDFPWAERMASAVGGIHPLQIADSLLRQGVSISYFGLEINLDYWPGGSAIRDPFQWIDLLDIWAQLEIPLVILLRAPFGGTRTPSDHPVDRLVNQQRSQITDSQRYEILRNVMRILMARPIVHGVVWSQWNDDSDSRFPHGGLFGPNGKKPLVDDLLQSTMKFRASSVTK